MPKKYGVKEKDLVVAHIIDLVLTGKLRGGDRIDRNAIAAELGVSRLPVHEAVAQLEHDGFVLTHYGRGAFVERFDEAVVREHHELYGMLIGMASARAAADPTPRVLADLAAAMQAMRLAQGPAFGEAAGQYRTIIVDEYAGPRLRAEISAARDLLPTRFWTGYHDYTAEIVASYEAETAAIRSRDPEAARGACVNRVAWHVDVVLAELAARGVFNDRAAGWTP
ncbi:GntR family transcriptional regulator [Mycolicibacter terrae]|uniref:GntR family transcriptional regulator n=2 Tax=Mycolicibacter TaxID=1073531 RepID=A0A1A2P0T0_MYCSD|nr:MULTISPECIES: GntR family transcriptional regulator [Mycolicibacter]OBH20934.1 GntR family transcriptional regulator [Mycolicibacter sinensis]OBI33621.1 GntR family transcriptional regulator [Mycolicibacter sinensis]RRR45915.1 GntR family transcriptional regulator [Mycolicibacter terrae]